MKIKAEKPQLPNQVSLNRANPIHSMRQQSKMMISRKTSHKKKHDNFDEELVADFLLRTRQVQTASEKNII